MSVPLLSFLGSRLGRFAPQVSLPERVRVRDLRLLKRLESELEAMTRRVVRERGGTVLEGRRVRGRARSS